MSYSFSTTFTRTHAREIASRVAADLYMMRALYGKPSADDIEAYEAEFVELLVMGYLKTVEYGFKRDGNRVVTLRYTVRPGSGEPDRAGSVFATADTAGATFFSFLEYTSDWDKLTSTERDAFEATLPIQRTFGTAPGNGNGYWVTDKAYNAAGVSASRETFRPAA